MQNGDDSNAYLSVLLKSYLNIILFCFIMMKAYESLYNEGASKTRLIWQSFSNMETVAQVYVFPLFCCLHFFSSPCRIDHLQFYFCLIGIPD